MNVNGVNGRPLNKVVLKVHSITERGISDFIPYPIVVRPLKSLGRNLVIFPMLPCLPASWRLRLRRLISSAASALACPGSFQAALAAFQAALAAFQAALAAFQAALAAS